MNSWLKRHTPEEEAAYAKVVELRKLYNLRFHHNPSGGEFWIDQGPHAGFRVQVSLYSPIKDLEKLENALKEAGIVETEDEADN